MRTSRWRLTLTTFSHRLMVRTRSPLLPHRIFRKSLLQLPDGRLPEFRSTASRATSLSPTCRLFWPTRNITALVTLPHRTTPPTPPPTRRPRPLHAPPPNRPRPPKSSSSISKKKNKTKKKQYQSIKRPAPLFSSFFIYFQLFVDLWHTSRTVYKSVICWGNFFFFEFFTLLIW